jgi:diguanylate cyclase (GGDEF)-like protein
LQEQKAHFLEKLANTDLLTGIYNRRKIEEVLTNVLCRSDRYGESFGVILCDLDHFKAVNDQYGHLVGDQVLIKAAECLKYNVRQTDAVGRWGGEEFLVVCVMTDHTCLYTIAEKLRFAIATSEFPAVHHKTASFGAAVHQRGETMTALLARTDQALYQAKENGRNQVVIAP